MSHSKWWSQDLNPHSPTPSTIHIDFHNSINTCQYSFSESKLSFYSFLLLALISGESGTFWNYNPEKQVSITRMISSSFTSSDPSQHYVKVNFIPEQMLSSLHCISERGSRENCLRAQPFASDILSNHTFRSTVAATEVTQGKGVGRDNSIKIEARALPHG